MGGAHHGELDARQHSRNGDECRIGTRVRWNGEAIQGIYIVGSVQGEDSGCGSGGSILQDAGSLPVEGLAQCDAHKEEGRPGPTCRDGSSAFDHQLRDSQGKGEIGAAPVHVVQNERHNDGRECGRDLRDEGIPYVGEHANRLRSVAPRSMLGTYVV